MSEVMGSLTKDLIKFTVDEYTRSIETDLWVHCHL